MTRSPVSRRLPLGALVGLLAGAVAVGVGQLVAGITGPAGSPVIEVGQLQIDLTPPGLKDFAIREFGSNDKTILVGGILVVLALLAAVLGVFALRRFVYGLVGLAILGVLGIVAVATRPDSRAVDSIPTLCAIAAAVLGLWLLVRRARLLEPAALAGATSPPVAAPSQGANYEPRRSSC